MTHPVPDSPITSLDVLLYDWCTATGYSGSDHDRAVLADLRERLLAREDNIADMLRLAGMQFGAFSEFVAEVICQTGLGTSPSDQERSLIHNRFHERMAQLRAEHPELFDDGSGD